MYGRRFSKRLFSARLPVDAAAAAGLSNRSQGRDAGSSRETREGRIPRVGAVPYARMDSELKGIVHASDVALGGSEWVQYFCHPTDLYKSFAHPRPPHVQARRRPFLCTLEWQ